MYIPYPRVNCLKTILFTAAHTYIAHMWQCPPGALTRRSRRNMSCFLVLINILIKTIIFAPCPRTTVSLKIQKLQLAELVGYTGSGSSEETIKLRLA